MAFANGLRRSLAAGASALGCSAADLPATSLRQMSGSINREPNTRHFAAAAQTGTTAQRDIHAPVEPARTQKAKLLVAAASAADLEALWEKHVATEFTEKSADAAVATMVSGATVNHMPTMTGGIGTQALREFYHKNFIPKMPPDVQLTPIDRSVGKDSVVDEFVFEFTHTAQMDWMVPGVAPTGKRVRVPFVAVVKFEGEKLKAERIYWDQATVLVQLGLLDPSGLPVTGREQAEKAADLTSHPSNALIRE